MILKLWTTKNFVWYIIDYNHWILLSVNKQMLLTLGHFTSRYQPQFKTHTPLKMSPYSRWNVLCTQTAYRVHSWSVKPPRWHWKPALMWEGVRKARLPLGEHPAERVCESVCMEAGDTQSKWGEDGEPNKHRKIKASRLFNTPCVTRTGSVSGCGH